MNNKPFSRGPIKQYFIGPIENTRISKVDQIRSFSRMPQSEERIQVHAFNKLLIPFVCTDRKSLKKNPLSRNYQPHIYRGDTQTHAEHLECKKSYHSNYTSIITFIEKLIFLDRLSYTT